MKQCYTFLIIGFLAISGCSIHAQNPTSKINIDLYLRWQESLKQSIFPEEAVDLLVQGDARQLKRLVEESKGYFKYRVGNIASVRLPMAAIGVLLSHPAITRLEAYRVEAADLFYEDTAMVNNNNLLPAHNGEGILPYGFQGEGTLVGIIDDGNEWKHPDFWNPEDSSTRFLHLWDQTQYNSFFYESFYAYGSSWTAADINTAGITHNPGVHGSHVLGSAAGNALAAGKYVGMAPKADLISVALRENGSFLPSFVDGVHFIFSKAASLGRPCAINSSVGTYYGSHDGTDLYTQLIEAMLDEAPGRALIQAAGNARQRKIHWQADLALGLADTSRIWMEYVTGTSSVFASFFADTADLHGLDFSFELIDRNTHQVKGQTQAYNILRDFQFTTPLPAERRDTLFFVNNQPIILHLYAECWAGYYEVFFRISGAQLGTTDYWQLSVSGVGKMDMWSSLMETGSSNMVMNGTTAHYRNPDNIQTIVSGWTCSDKIITVASYQNRTWLENYSGDTVSLAVVGYPKWGISQFSSLGPTRDGRQKPDLTAPGGRIMSAAPLSLLNNYRSSGFVHLDKGGWHIQNSGTSMSAPMVTGAAALYFQCRPDATYAHVKEALEQSARLDSFVFVESSTIPNIHWGYGKLDVFELLKGCLLYGCTDSAAPNFNPMAHLEDGSCMLPVTVDLIMMGDSEYQNWTLMPNPAAHECWFQANTEINREGLELRCYNALGQELFRKNILNTKEAIDIQGMTTGLYYMVLYQHRQRMGAQKLIIK